MSPDLGDNWQVDRKIPVVSIFSAFIFIVVQTVTVAWFLSGLHYRVVVVEDFVKATQPQSAQIAVMQEKITSVQVALDRVEASLRAMQPGFQTSPTPIPKR